MITHLRVMLVPRRSTAYFHPFLIKLSNHVFCVAECRLTDPSKTIRSKQKHGQQVEVE